MSEMAVWISPGARRVPNEPPGTVNRHGESEIGYSTVVIALLGAVESGMSLICLETVLKKAVIVCGAPGSLSPVNSVSST